MSQFLESSHVLSRVITPCIYRAVKNVLSHNSMPPTFSKVAVEATPRLISGLRCGHADCYALFSTLEDSEEHALRAHSGNVAAVTCNIQEKKLASGQVQLCRVLDKDGEEAFKIFFECLPSHQI